MVANGEPARVLALVDPDSDLADGVARTGRAVVQLLSWSHRDLAEAFAGTAPAPGGPFRMATFEDTAWGPRLADAATWAGSSLESAAEVGWSSLLTCVVEEVVGRGRRRAAGAPARPLRAARARERRGWSAWPSCSRSPTSSTACRCPSSPRRATRGRRSSRAPPLAAQVKALRKPSTAAWVVNLLVRRETEQVEQVLAVGAALREAQASMSGDELRALTRQRRQLTAAVTTQARRVARKEPAPGSPRRSPTRSRRR